MLQYKILAYVDAFVAMRHRDPTPQETQAIDGADRLIKQTQGFEKYAKRRDIVITKMYDRKNDEDPWAFNPQLAWFFTLLSDDLVAEVDDVFCFDNRSRNPSHVSMASVQTFTGGRGCGISGPI